MKNDICAQAVSLSLSLFLGMAAALLYDLLRVLRLRRRSHSLTHLLDGVYVCLTALLLFWLAIAVGQGRLRLYMMSGAAAGYLLWWLWPGPQLLCVWNFWLDTAVSILRWLRLPLLRLKKLFSFFSRWSIMKKINRKEQPSHGKKAEEKTPCP